MTREGDPLPDDEEDRATVARRVGRVRSGAPAASEVRSARSPASETPRAGLSTGSEGPRARSASGASMTGAAMAEVMFEEEATRVHGFALAIPMVALGVAALLPVLGGDPLAKALCGAALMVIALASAWVWRLTRPPVDRTRYSERVFRAYGWTLSVAIVFVEYYIGFFSPVATVLALGIYYLSQSNDRLHSVMLPTFVTACYSALSMLTAVGVLEDRGLFSAQAAGLGSRLFGVVGVTAILLVTLGMARISRRAMREAIERSNEALLVAQQREAQLAEAHHQLDRALRVAVGKPGRYTGALAGEHRLGVVIGVGAIGEVYAAEHVRTSSEVAVKLLQAAALERDDLVERILREGALSSQLDSPHVVRVFEAGRLSDGAPYLTMELLRGRDLAARLRQEGQLPLAELARLAAELGAGLQHAHDAGIVHRDLKPLNIYEAEQNGVLQWKILDFGISKLANSGGTLTQEGVVGTPGYMSPEQARGARVDHRSDVFSMAVVLYRAMTGQPAFPGDGTPQIMFDIVYKMPKRPSNASKNLPHELDAVMAIALAKDPEDRFQSARELADAFVLASKHKLSHELRQRAASLLRALPWGSTMTARGGHADERGGD
jgi:hypothetical protein